MLDPLARKGSEVRVCFSAHASVGFLGGSTSVVSDNGHLFVLWPLSLYASSSPSHRRRSNSSYRILL